MGATFWETGRIHEIKNPFLFLGAWNRLGFFGPRETGAPLNFGFGSWTPKFSKKHQGPTAVFEASNIEGPRFFPGGLV